MIVKNAKDLHSEDLRSANIIDDQEIVSNVKEPGFVNIKKENIFAKNVEELAYAYMINLGLIVISVLLILINGVNIASVKTLKI